MACFKKETNRYFFNLVYTVDRKGAGNMSPLTYRYLLIVERRTLWNFDICREQGQRL